jgi:hypothetical protein
VPKNIFFSSAVKNKPHDGETEHVFILGSLECTVANTSYGSSDSIGCICDQNLLSKYGTICSSGNPSIRLSNQFVSQTIPPFSLEMDFKEYFEQTSIFFS